MQLGVQSVAFPAISTGAYGYPMDHAAEVAARTIAAAARAGAAPPRVVLACLGASAVRQLERALAAA